MNDNFYHHHHHHHYLYHAITNDKNYHLVMKSITQTDLVIFLVYFNSKLKIFKHLI